MIIFGIDPGSVITGYGVIRADGNKVSWVDSGVIKTGKTDDLPQKLCTIYDSLIEKMGVHLPSIVCVEEAFYAKNVHTTLVLGHARGVAMLAAKKTGAIVEEYSPREIKKTVVGSGSATKDQVEFMVRTLLSPPVTHLHADAYDALAVALCGFSQISFKIAATRRLG